MVYVERININPPKLKRFPIGEISKKRNPLSVRELKELLSFKVIVEEKMDGTPLKLISNDPQLFIFVSDLYNSNSIHYRLPGRYAIVEIFDPSSDLFVSWDERFKLSMELRKGKIRVCDTDSILFFPIPQIAYGKFRMKELIQFLGVSAYACRHDNIDVPMPGKGIVVKPGCGDFPEMYQPGQILLSEFLSEATENYLKRYGGDRTSPLCSIMSACHINKIDPLTRIPDYLLSDHGAIKKTSILNLS